MIETLTQKTFHDHKHTHKDMFVQTLVKRNIKDRKQVNSDYYDVQIKDNPTKNNHEELAKKVWNTMTPGAWVKENNVMSFLDLSCTDFIEDAETGEIHELSPIQIIEHEAMIKRERKKLYETRVKLGIIEKDVSMYNYFNFWIPVCQINAMRAAPIWNRQRVIKGDLQLFILNAIKETGSITPTKLINKYIDEIWEEPENKVKKILKRPLENLLKDNVIKLDDKIKGFKCYKFDDVTIEDDKFLRNK